MATFDKQGRLKVFVDGISITISGGSGTGDVEGPGSSVDNALSRFDGTTGKIIQNSNAILSDSGVLSLSGGLNITGNLDLLGDVELTGILSASVGGDLLGTLPSPEVIAFTSGSTQILFTSILDGEFLQRSGNTIVSVSSSSMNLAAQESTANATITTTSTTPIDAPGVTLTLEAGRYYILFSTQGSHSNNNSILAIGIAVDGSDILSSERNWGGTNRSDDVIANLFTQSLISVSIGQVITGRFWKSSGNGSVALENRSIIAVRIGS